MIETGKQATKAVKAIMRKTGWSCRKIGAKTGVTGQTIWRISRGETDAPGEALMESIDNLHKEWF